MSNLDFHVLVRAETREAQMDEIQESVDGDGTIELMARRKEHVILRISAPSDTYLYLLLKYGKDAVWLR
jgi:hypothetical protein